MRLTTNAQQLARRFGQRATRVITAWQRGLRRIAARGEKEMQDRLSGRHDDAPGSFPVPNRTGTLFRAAGAQPEGRSAVIMYNTAAYANAVNEPWSASDGRSHEAQPFATEAAEAVQKRSPKIMAVALREAWR